MNSKYKRIHPTQGKEINRKEEALKKCDDEAKSQVINDLLMKQPHQIYQLSSEFYR